MPFILLMRVASAIGLHGGLVLALALSGLVTYLTRQRRRGWKSAIISLFAPSQGGLFFLSVLWLLYLLYSGLAGVEFQGVHDAVPAMFLIAFWSSCGCLELCSHAKNSGRLRSKLPRIHSDRATSLMIMMTLVTMSLSLTRSLFYRVKYSLAEQTAFVKSVTAMAEPDASLLAINAEEFYVLTEQRSPWRTIRIQQYFLQFIEQIQSSGCHDLVQDIRRNNYRLVVVRERLADSNKCLSEIITQLQGDYEQTTFPMGEVGCGTSALLGDFVDHPQQTLSTFNIESWAGCFLKLNWRPSLQLNSGTYYVFTSS